MNLTCGNQFRTVFQEKQGAFSSNLHSTGGQTIVYPACSLLVQDIYSTKYEEKNRLVSKKTGSYPKNGIRIPLG